MKSKKTKTLVAWLVGITFAVGAGALSWFFDIGVGITCFPHLITVCKWLIGAVLSRFGG